MRLLILAILLVVPLTAAINEEVLLDSIASVETGNRDLVGAAHETGPWQLLPSVAQRVGGHDRRAALKWLHIVEADLARRGAFVSVHSCALSWNAGVRATTEGRAPMSSYLYAQRVCSAYDSRLVRALSRPFTKPSLTPSLFTVPSHS